MGLFNKKQKERTYEENGYIIGVDSHVIYHMPRDLKVYVLPESAVAIREEAIFDISHSVEQIVVPGSFKRFDVNLQSCKNIKKVVLNEGVEEINCLVKTGNVDFELPSTIKKIGKDNYPIVKNLVIPNGVEIIKPLFASHDTNLISVDIPGTLKKIPVYAFNQCKNLQTIIMHEGVETAEINSFFNTNNLHTLKIPSTFNGRIDLTMEAREGTNPRGNSKYDGKNFEQEKKEIMSVFIKRGDKDYEFKIKRGDCPIINISQNNIIIYITNGPGIDINCNSLKSGVYQIDNAKLIAVENKEKPDPIKKTDELPIEEQIIIAFQEAYKECVVAREDFKSLSFQDKIKVKNYIRDSFIKNIEMTGKINTSFSAFDNWFNKAINEINSMEIDQDNIKHR